MISVEEALSVCPIVAILRGLEPERAEVIGQALSAGAGSITPLIFSPPGFFRRRCQGGCRRLLDLQTGHAGGPDRRRCRHPDRGLAGGRPVMTARRDSSHKD